MATGWREETCVTAHDHRECVATHYSERNPKPLPRRFKEKSEPAATLATNPVSRDVVRSPPLERDQRERLKQGSASEHSHQRPSSGHDAARALIAE